MFQLDEKTIRDNRTLITIQGNKYQIDPLNKNGTINYVSEGDNVFLTTPKIKANYLKKVNPVDMFDKFILARNGMDIDGIYSFDDDITFKQNVEVKKNIVIRGDLTVEGKSTIIDTPRLSIEDNIIELNKNETGVGISLKRSGTAINRGTKHFARYLFDEDSKSFVLDTASGIDNAVDNTQWIFMAYAEDNGDFKSGEVRARFRLTAPHGKFTDSLIVGNNTILNNLTVNGETTLKGLTTTNDININGILTANNSTIFNGIITANKAATFKDNVLIDKDITVKGASTFTGLLTANGGASINGEFNVSGTSKLIGTLNVSENVSFSKDLSVTSNINATNITASETIRGKNLAILANADIGGDVGITGNLTVNKKATFNRDVVFNNGPVTFNTHVDFNRDISINNKNLTITSDSDSNGQLLVGGHTSIKKTLTVNGDTILKGNVNIQGSLDMSNSNLVARTIRAKNEYQLDAGDGKGIKFWDSDYYMIYMSNTQSPGWGGRLDNNSDYNMYFKMNSGTNRGFAFKSGNNVVTQIESTGKIRTNDNIIIKGYAALSRQDEGHRDDNSGINADRLDGYHANDFIKKSGDTMTGPLKTIINKWWIGTGNYGLDLGNSDLIGASSIVFADESNAGDEGLLFPKPGKAGSRTLTDYDAFLIYDGQPKLNGKKVWYEDNDGHNSGLDADTLDGHHADYFALANHNHDNVYAKKTDVDLQQVYSIKYNPEFDSMDFIYNGR